MNEAKPLIHLHRTNHLEDRTLGELSVYDASGVLRFEGFGLEPPWRGNRIGESCIPQGSTTCGGVGAGATAST